MSNVFDLGSTNVALALDVPFPANVVSGPGVGVTKSGGIWTVGLNYPALNLNTNPVPSSNFFTAIYDQAGNAYEQVRIDTLLGAATGVDQRTAIGDANYVCTVNDRYVALAATLTAARTITLPSASAVPPGRSLTIADEAGGITTTNTLSIVTQGGNTIDNAATPWVVNVAYGGVTFRSDGVSKWTRIDAISVAGYAGGTILGNVTISGGNLVVNPNGIAVQGALGSFTAYDQGTGGGNTANMVQLFRAGNVGTLQMTEAQVMTMSTAGTATFQHAVGVTGLLTASGGISATGNVAATGQIQGAAGLFNSGGASYPLSVTCNAGQSAAAVYQVSGSHAYYLGAWSDGTFSLYDNTNAKYYWKLTAAGVFQHLPRTTFLGDFGDWDGTAMFNCSPAAAVGLRGASFYTSGTSSYQATFIRGDAANSILANLGYTGAAQVGTIVINGTANGVAYNTTSDGRLKQAVRPLAGEIDVGAVLDAIEPVAFEWTSNNATDHGFVAQDLYKVCPLAVTPGLDAYNPELQVGAWGADFSKLIPVMIAEIQSLRARLAKLEGGAR